MLLSLCQAQKLDVFQNGKVLGTIDSTTAFRCDSCYTIQQLEIGKKSFSFKIPVSVVEVNKRSFFQANYDLSVIDKNKEKVLQYANHNTSEISFFRIKQDRKNKIFIDYSLKSYNGIHRQKIGPKDYEGFQATTICEYSHKYELEKINSLDSFKFTKCFDCPINLSLDECLARKKSNKKFEWK